MRFSKAFNAVDHAILLNKLYQHDAKNKYDRFKSQLNN